MAPPVFTGALMPKKKGELQDISSALRISDQGTKDELLNRIKRHLELNPDLEEDPSFAGLFGNRRKRSIQPQAPVSSSRSFDKPTSRGRRVLAMDPVRESTPVGDLRDVSMFLKQPISPFESTPDRSAEQVLAITPSSLPPLPPSPAKSLIEHHLPTSQDVEALAAKIKENEILQNGLKTLGRIHKFLSNSTNIWALSSSVEILLILYSVVPWKSAEFPLIQLPNTRLSFKYPPLSIFQMVSFWMVLWHWIFPAVVIPALVGSLISFTPKAHREITPDMTRHLPPFDNLTASIVRLAVQVVYPYKSLAENIRGVDVLGYQWRVVGASVGLAFAFAEAIAESPKVAAQTFATERRVERLLENSAHTESPSGRRRAIMPSDSQEGSEVD